MIQDSDAHNVLRNMGWEDPKQSLVQSSSKVTTSQLFSFASMLSNVSSDDDSDQDGTDLATVTPQLSMLPSKSRSLPSAQDDHDDFAAVEVAADLSLQQLTRNVYTGNNDCARFENDDWKLSATYDYNDRRGHSEVAPVFLTIDDNRDVSDTETAELNEINNCDDQYREATPQFYLSQEHFSKWAEDAKIASTDPDLRHMSVENS